MSDTYLRLGDVTFSNLEIPESLTLGGAQRLAVHTFPGGARNVQALGAEHAPIAWRGLMLGESALERAKGIDFLRVQGRALPLTVFDSVYTVVIDRFEYAVERFYKVGYSINLFVVSDDSQPVDYIAPAGFDSAIGEDSDALGFYAGAIGDGPLSSAVGALGAIVSRVGTFATATNATISGVTNAISAVAARADVLTLATAATVNGVGVIGGIIPNAPLAAQTVSMAAQVAATARYPVLLSIGSVCDRMARNVVAASQQASNRTVQVAGGTLFDVAAQEYGDATRWTAIAAASGIRDAQLTGVNTLTIPARPIDSGGVPTQ